MKNRRIENRLAQLVGTSVTSALAGDAAVVANRQAASVMPGSLEMGELLLKRESTTG